MSPQRKKLMRGRTKNKTRRSSEGRNMENDEEEKNRHEVDMADLDDEISVSSDSSSSIESSKPWQKKKSPSSNSEGTNFSSPFNEISLVASLPSRIIKGKPKKKRRRDTASMIQMMMTPTLTFM